MHLSDLKNSGHWPTLLTAFLYFDVSFMVWTVMGPLAGHIGNDLGLDAGRAGLMVATPILAGAVLRLFLGVLVDRIGAKRTGLLAQVVVMAGLTVAWLAGLPSFYAVLGFGLILGFAGASFAVALPQAGQWYPPRLQGLVMGIAGAGNIGVVLDSLIAPRLAQAWGWQNVFGFALIPVVLVFVAYALFAKDPPVTAGKRRMSDCLRLLREPDAHWFCFYYTVSFGGFVGLAGFHVLYFTREYGMSMVQAGDIAAICTFAGAIARPAGGAIADRFGGIRSLTTFFALAAAGVLAAGFSRGLSPTIVSFAVASSALGMANGAVFQLLPQRFGADIGLMTGLAGCGGGIGGFCLAASLGYARNLTGSSDLALVGFAGLCVAAIAGLCLVRSRWRMTWGALSEARI